MVNVNCARDPQDESRRRRRRKEGSKRMKKEEAAMQTTESPSGEVKVPQEGEVGRVNGLQKGGKKQ